MRFEISLASLAAFDLASRLLPLPKASRIASRHSPIYSILNTCNALGINSYDYLVDVLERVSPNADFRALTPWAWEERRRLAESAADAELQSAPQ